MIYGFILKEKLIIHLLQNLVKRIIVNNVLLLEINNMGLLEKKEFLDLTNMQELKFAEQITENQYKKNTFVYNFLSSMRQKINDPLGKRKR